MENKNKVPYQVGSKSFTAVAINTASIAGEWIKSNVGKFTTVNVKSSEHDIVTEIDKGAETMIRNLLRTHFPHHAILGEEGVNPGPAASREALEAFADEEYLWIVDPIDGTTNYVHGFPFYSVSIALAHKGEVIVGVVYDLALDEMFVAEKGKGAYVRGSRTNVSNEQSLATSLVATGFSPDIEGSLKINMKQLQVVAPQVRNIRSAGSAALHLAYVAAGRLCGFWEIGLNSWDVAAGVLLVQEAGGQVSDTSGGNYDLKVRNVLATNGHIHDQLLTQLKSVK